MSTDYANFTQKLIEDIRTNGRPTSGPMAGAPLLVLTTTGATTGLPRTAIVTYSRDADRYVIAASKSGAPSHPVWFHNLEVHPEVTVEVGRETFRARATVATGAERDRLWDNHVAARPEFGDYPAKTDRLIPMIWLDRIA